MKTAIPSFLEDLPIFLDQGVSPWHAVQESIQRLKKQGFQELKENETWKIKPGQKYFVTRNGSSLCAFVTPLKMLERTRILAAHTDSPTLKLKPQPEIRRQNMILFGVEVYGAPMLASWLNRDLGLAGRIVYYDRKNKLQESLVNLNEHPFIIPQLAIHLDREVNEKGPLLNKQDHLNVLAALDDTGTSQSYLETLLKEKISLKEILNYDLFFYPLEKGRLIGQNGQLLSSYRIDNLASVHAALYALIDEADPLENDLKMLCFWDNEEIGSHTAQGAASPFLLHTVERIMIGLKLDREAFLRMIPQSICFSIDLAHAQNPNYMEKHDPQHPILLNKGAVLKTNAQNRYASDAHSASILQNVARALNLSLQKFVSRNDIACGSTIGPIHASLSGMPTVDLGCSQLSMHSSRELMAIKDHFDLYQLLKGALSLSK